MSNRARLLSRVHGVDPNGTVWAFESDGSRIPVYNVAELPSDYARLLVAAPLMLRAIETGLPMLDTVQRIFETHNMDAYAISVMQLESGLNVALKSALFGLK